MADKVKVVGYAQRVFYDNGIEYRNFSDDLVGFQLASDGGTPTFTSGNFVVTTTIDRKPSKLFLTTKFSPFLKLEDLQLEVEMNQLIVEDNKIVKLNLDKSNLCNYAYFGSLREFIRVSLEDIIIRWPASLYVTDSDVTQYNATGYTIENYQYNPITQISTFTVQTNRITNRYNINYNQNGNIINTFNETNDLRNMSVNYGKYVIAIDDNEYPVLDFTGSTTNKSYLDFTVKGELFTGSTASTLTYHIKPNKDEREIFFKTVPDFGSYLLNRFVSPQYTATFKYLTETETGAIINSEKIITWPTTDGYNIDFDTDAYIKYVSELLELADGNDSTKTDLMVRHLTSESISDFDTFPTCEGEIEETAGQKMNKSLKIYGREYDEIKRFIDGIAFANTVTYNKKDNTPDIFLKNLGRIFGWELISSTLENDLLNAYLTPADSSYSGHSRGYTPAEAEIEMWRRIIMNTPWIWKSKGTRKGVEFLLRFIGTPNGLIEFNEFIYKAKNPQNMRVFRDLLFEKYGDESLDGLNLDSEGYPRVLPNTPEMYFQMAGLWYRQTGGPDSNIDILDGNNPHIGPYDGGQAYIDQFGCLIPDFSATTIYTEEISTGSTNIFTNYNSGLINNAPEEEVWADLVNEDNISLSDCYEIIAQIIEDPKPTTELTDCGCETGEADDSIRICINKIDKEVSSPTPNDCGYTGFTLDPSGYVQFNLASGKVTTTTTQQCCEALGFTYQSGDISCYWNTQITSPIEICKGWEPALKEIFDNGLVPFYNNELQVGNTVVGSAECCEAYGFTAVPVESGGFQCYDMSTVNCGDYTVFETSKETGIVTFENQFGQLTNSIPLQCCEYFGLISDGVKSCIDPNWTDPNDPTIPTGVSLNKDNKIP